MALEGMSMCRRPSWAVAARAVPRIVQSSFLRGQPGLGRASVARQQVRGWITGFTALMALSGVGALGRAEPGMTIGGAGDSAGVKGGGLVDLAALGNEVCRRLEWSARKWRQIAPAVHHLARQHAEAIEALSDDGRVATLVALATFIDAKRKATGGLAVLAPGRTVIGLLDPDQGLGPKEVTAIADAYGCTSTIFKKQAAGDTLDSVADAFLASVTAAVTTGKPTTVIVLGHGLPTEIQSYHIRFERLAKALLDGVPPAAAVDLSSLVLVCDDCFSADFQINLLGEITREAERRRLPLTSLPVCIAGTNCNRVGFVAVGEKFVPHFWRDVIELYFIRRPRPKVVTLADFFENVDNMMYGYGRAVILEDGRVAGYRLINADLVQDPVVFVPLQSEDLAKLRAILGLPSEALLSHWLDVG